MGEKYLGEKSVGEKSFGENRGRWDAGFRFPPSQVPPFWVGDWDFTTCDTRYL